jgi:hypothetical protein
MVYFGVNEPLALDKVQELGGDRNAAPSVAARELYQLEPAFTGPA